MKKLIYFCLFLLAVSCQKEPFTNLSHTFTIKEGNHRDEKEPILLLPAKDEIEGFIYLDPSMIAQEGIVSKIVGISGPDNHKNSARLGWRTVGDRIELVTYVYVDGQSPQESADHKQALGMYPTGINVWFKIKFEHDCWAFYVEETKVTIPGKLPALRYISMPWYGGVQCAPHDIKVTITYKL